MILEVAILKIKTGQGAAFEKAFAGVQHILASSRGCISHEFRKCVERPDQYLLLVQWQSIEDHEVGFRSSPEYQEWKKVLHPFYEPFPVVEHYLPVIEQE